jgi:uncharacterized membrane protein
MLPFLRKNWWQYLQSIIDDITPTFLPCRKKVTELCAFVVVVVVVVVIMGRGSMAHPNDTQIISVPLYLLAGSQG